MKLLPSTVSSSSLLSSRCLHSLAATFIFVDIFATRSCGILAFSSLSTSRCLIPNFSSSRTTSWRSVGFTPRTKSGNNGLSPRSQPLLQLWKNDIKSTERTTIKNAKEPSTNSSKYLFNINNTYFSKFMVPFVTVSDNNWADTAVSFILENLVGDTKTAEDRSNTTAATATEEGHLFSFISSISLPPIPFLKEWNDTRSGSQKDVAVAKPFQKYMIKEQDLSVEAFGPLLPLAERVDEWTGGWGLFYADLHPETTTSFAGVAFLLTNLAYAVAGFVLTLQGEILLGTMTECAGAVSFWYHYSQLKYSGQEKNVQVRLALLTDYIFAGSALITGAIYALMIGPFALPLNALLSAVGAILCLTLSWTWEFGLPYIVWHSMWHILSALTGYLIGQARIDGTTTSDVLMVNTISQFFLLPHPLPTGVELTI